MPPALSVPLRYDWHGLAETETVIRNRHYFSAFEPAWRPLGFIRKEQTIDYLAGSNGVAAVATWHPCNLVKNRYQVREIVQEELSAALADLTAESHALSLESPAQNRCQSLHFFE
jgi:hypothetical protein